MCTNCGFGIAERLPSGNLCPATHDFRHASISSMNQLQVTDSKNALDGSDMLGNMGVWTRVAAIFIAF
ncbi:hypothetical protein X739_11885 [Mesorhizobium sp. LNHC220B00]|nr:hypothetical protein X739_11885 [Mesorhizobium sp. LNHC220B00]